MTDKPKIPADASSAFTIFLEEHGLKMFPHGHSNSVIGPTMRMAESLRPYDPELVTLSLMELKTYKDSPSIETIALLQTVTGLEAPITSAQTKNLHTTIRKLTSKNANASTDLYTIVSDQIQAVVDGIQANEVRVLQHASFHCSIVEVVNTWAYEGKALVWRFWKQNNSHAGTH